MSTAAAGTIDWRYRSSGRAGGSALGIIIVRGFAVRISIRLLAEEAAGPFQTG